MDENSNSRSSTDSVDVAAMESSPPLINGHIDMEQFNDEGLYKYNQCYNGF